MRKRRWGDLKLTGQCLPMVISIYTINVYLWLHYKKHSSNKKGITVQVPFVTCPTILNILTNAFSDLTHILRLFSRIIS